MLFIASREHSRSNVGFLDFGDAPRSVFIAYVRSVTAAENQLRFARIDLIMAFWNVGEPIESFHDCECKANDPTIATEVM
jgi:hypothetical protein